MSSPIASTSVPKSKKSKSQKKQAQAPTSQPIEDILTPDGPTSLAVPSSAQVPAAADESPITLEETKNSKKGPVEEMIAKRLRLLGKKIQRFKTYSSQAPETLNNDQRAALASLPILEGAWKELDDVMKYTEIIELEEAAKAREVKAQDEEQSSLQNKQGVEDFKEALSSPLSAFLRLYSLLHPARPSDHTHITFSHLDLPAHLQDEVRATDVLRVAAWYAALVNGTEESARIIGLLVAGPTGLDDEDDHVHHLLKLIDQPHSDPEPEVSLPATAEPYERGLPDAEVGTEVANGHSEEDKITFAPFDQDDEPKVEVEEGETQPQRGVSLNFLQEDELASEEKEGEEFEVIAMPEAHEVGLGSSAREYRLTDVRKTSGLQPPPTIATPPVLAEPVSVPTLAPPPLDWAAEEEEEDEAAAAEQIRGALSGAATPSAAKTLETSIPQQSEVASVVETPALAVEPSTTEAPTTPITSSPKVKKPKQTRPKQPPQPQQPAPKQIVDEDGFVLNVKRTASAPRGGAARGRGSFRGRGNGRAPSTNFNGPNPNPTPFLQRKPSGFGDAKEQTKTSIYKNGPKTAPVTQEAAK
ncbi:hypothetical protein P7C73_g901, partial [Tremellales sp. Uapishka_1]